MSAVESHKIEMMGQLASAAYFTVDTSGTVDSVPLTVPASGLMTNGRLKTAFINGDAIALLSIAYKMPLGFEFYKTSDNVDFKTVIELNLIKESSNDVLMSIDRIFHPFECTEISYGVYYKNSYATGENYRIDARFVGTPQVSMIGVNKSLNSKTFYCPIFLKIEHTLAMVE